MNVHCKLKIHEMQILLCCYHFRKLNLSRHRPQCLWLRSAVHGQCGECQSLSFCEPQLSDLCPSSDVVILEINLTNEIFSLLSLLSGQSYRPVPPGLPRSPMLFQKKYIFRAILDIINLQPVKCVKYTYNTEALVEITLADVLHS